MGELAVKFQSQQGVGIRTDEDVEIRRESGEKAGSEGEASFPFVSCASPREGGASESLGERVHSYAGCEVGKVARLCLTE